MVIKITVGSTVNEKTRKFQNCHNMPPFRLELPDRKTNANLKSRIFYTKNEYSQGVKFNLIENKPYDTDPYCPGKVNHFLSHYNRLGVGGDSDFLSTTHEMLQQISLPKKHCEGKKDLISFYTFNDNMDCQVNKSGYCNAIFAEDLTTTMQHSYPPPHPYVMPKLGFPLIPHMQNRKFKREDPMLSQFKFYDEGFHKVTYKLQKNKGFRWTSFNPWMGVYTNEYEK